MKMTTLDASDKFRKMWHHCSLAEREQGLKRESRLGPKQSYAEVEWHKQSKQLKKWYENTSEDFSSSTFQN